MNSKNIPVQEQIEVFGTAALFSARKFWFILAVLLGVVGAGMGTYAYRESTRPAGLADIDTDLSQQEREKVAAYLNGHVRLRDFTASVHAVEDGENFWGIAKDYGVDIDTIVGCNPDLENLNARLNQPLLAVSRRGALYQVRQGEKIADIAAALSVSPQVVADANPVGWFGLRPGSVLFVPGAKPYHLVGAMVGLYEKRKLFRSPLSGAYTSLEGMRIDPFTGDLKHHNGVDIRAKYGAPVSAAAKGVVEYSGWNGGYGKCVVIRHTDGYKTLYGHLSAYFVRAGQKIKQGHFIGRVGMTGRTTGPHLHFTIWLKNKVQNPLKYLW